jgi:hypothetical protein
MHFVLRTKVHNLQFIVHFCLAKCVKRGTASLCRSKMREFSPKSNANNETAGRNYLSVTTVDTCAPDDTCIALIACVRVTTSKPDGRANKTDRKAHQVTCLIFWLSHSFIGKKLNSGVRFIRFMPLVSSFSPYPPSFILFRPPVS